MPKCEYCGKEMELAKSTNLRGLYWLIPDEKLVCPECDASFSKKVICNSKIIPNSSPEHRKMILQEARDFVNFYKKEILEQIKEKNMDCL